MIRVVFFASVREAVGIDQLELEATRPGRVADIIATLGERGPAWRSALTAENLLVAVNQTMVSVDHDIGDGDELAFFPPVTGG